MSYTLSSTLPHVPVSNSWTCSLFPALGHWHRTALLPKMAFPSFLFRKPFPFLLALPLFKALFSFCSVPQQNPGLIFILILSFVHNQDLPTCLLIDLMSIPQVSVCSLRIGTITSIGLKSKPMWMHEWEKKYMNGLEAGWIAHPLKSKQIARLRTILSSKAFCLENSDFPKWRQLLPEAKIPGENGTAVVDGGVTERKSTGWLFKGNAYLNERLIPLT